LRVNGLSYFALRSKRRNGAFLKSKLPHFPARHRLKAKRSAPYFWPLHAFSEKTTGCLDRIRAPFSGISFIWGLDPEMEDAKKHAAAGTGRLPGLACDVVRSIPRSLRPDLFALVPASASLIFFLKSGSRKPATWPELPGLIGR
jgi:hypothetical protein